MAGVGVQARGGRGRSPISSGNGKTAATLLTPPTVNVCAASITRSRQLRHALLACAIAQKEGEGGSNHRSLRGAATAPVARAEFLISLILKIKECPKNGGIFDYA